MPDHKPCYTFVGQIDIRELERLREEQRRAQERRR